MCIIKVKLKTGKKSIYLIEATNQENDLLKIFDRLKYVIIF